MKKELEKELEYEEPKGVTPEMRVALATAWANRGFREYMTIAVNKSRYDASLSKDMDTLARRQGRIMALLQLKGICEKCFYDNVKLEQSFKIYEKKGSIKEEVLD